MTGPLGGKIVVPALTIFTGVAVGYYVYKPILHQYAHDTDGTWKAEKLEGKLTGPPEMKEAQADTRSPIPDRRKL
ncbi:uncharacterized protein L969DRAFT_92030 [Mixia osmundae IAM 14324]|uniref:Uncharacterized protein n=1 Tax=Mixia osmundae (strain CBS 9802 / IAM 14324 / JCM 22182 / KY 12970) TaxID=764103 RepID=G7DZD0_MIXOS|nr:uncharacterized protein L969DRAFT_92030 [Mixia osmundae IAM 14324]KEI42595.1 hypothetical protein L969DRAFT_92030 [Mixia osmundae IAM 14324]GAA95940.1 hypothetical protein E5Q_02598 [Mixia osmundae IAM 14324]